MLNKWLQLYIEDITKVLGNIYNKVQKQILISIIIDTIYYTYLDIVYKVFRSNLDKYLHMPQLNILKSIKTTHVTLGPILDSKSLINSNYHILKTIFLEQLYLDYNKDFKDYLFLIYSNQKTIQLIYTYKHKQAESRSIYNSYKQVLPILGLQHLQLNFLYIVIRIFFSSKRYI